MRFGPYMFHAFKVLAKLRRLRGTPFDLFGYSHDRKLERKVLDDYLSILEAIKSNVTEQKLSIALEFARLPQSVRGYGPVKEVAIAEFEIKSGELLEALTDKDYSFGEKLAS